MQGMAKEMESHPNSTSLENRINEENDLVTRMTRMVEKVQPASDDFMFLEQCIYRVPYDIQQTNPKAYTPGVVSIGPIHSPFREGGDSRLKPMEEVKRKYLKSFLGRTQLSVGDCCSKLKSWEEKMRRCYAEPVELNSDDFLNIVMIDACFIIEYFFRVYRHKDWFGMDPILSKPTRNHIMHDFMLLENQLPFFVLEGIYNLSVASPQLTTKVIPTFLSITFKFFEHHNPQKKTSEKVAGVRVHHFVDLLRIFMLPDDRQLPDSTVEMVEHLYSASQLSEAGLVFKVCPSKCLLDLKFDKGVLTMPCFKIYDNTEGFMRNIIAFELCHYLFSSYITAYILILDFLINTRKDVETLVHEKIIVNFLGNDEAVATVVNSLCSNITVPDITSEFRTLCDDLNGFYENPCNKYKTVFIHEYLNTPWKIASTIAAILLLLLTFIQTVCSIVSLFKD